MLLLQKDGRNQDQEKDPTLILGKCQDYSRTMVKKVGRIVQGRMEKPFTCFKCSSEYHLAPKCTKPRNEASEVNILTLSSDETELKKNPDQDYLY